MNDKQTTMAQLKQAAAEFVQERDWEQFHGAKNLSTGIAIEAAELMELFVWTTDKHEAAQIVKQKQTLVQQELADIVITALLFANEFDIDVSSAIKQKLALNRQKYPIEKSKGVNKKYDEI